VSSRLAEMKARRIALQAACARQRAEASANYRGIAEGAARVDHIVDVARSMAPVIAVVGVLALLALGPGRALGLARRALAVAVVVRQARSLVA
jgi:TPP-dependent pyruvate/acetoin dehydrogenase alpha subunit